MIAPILHALRHSSRGMLRDRGFAAVAAISIALGVGANAAIFSLVDQVLLRLLPVNEPDRLVLLEWNGRFVGGGWGSGPLLPYPVCQELQNATDVFDDVFCRHPTTVNLSTGGDHHTVGAEIVSGTYFPTLGVRPSLGRLIDESDNLQPGAHPVIVLSHDYWKNNLGSPADIVGGTALVNNHPMTVIGVAAANFRGMDIGETPALWIPAMMKKQATPHWDQLFSRRTRWMHVFARLKLGVTPEQAEAGIQPWFKAMLQADTEREEWPRVTDERLREFLASTLAVRPGEHGQSALRGRLEQPLRVLMAGTLLLLALACLNVANLFLARGTARAREIATRMALGGSRLRIAGELLADSILLALAGGLIGLAMAPLVTEALVSFLARGVGGVDLTTDLSARVLAYAFLASTLTGCLAAVAPALQAGRTPLISPLKDRSGSGGGGTARLRKVLVVGQMAFALLLLVGAGLFVRTLDSLKNQGPGFPTADLFMFSVNPPLVGHSSEYSTRLIRNLLDDVRAAPEVASAAIAWHELLSGGGWGENLTLEAEGRITTDRSVLMSAVSPDFFSTLGAPLVAGRLFDDRDTRPAGPEVAWPPFRSAVVNESLARRYFGDVNPVGRRLGLGDRPDTPTNIEIVGVVRDFRYGDLREDREQAFVPVFESGSNAAVFYVRARGDARSAVTAIREAVRKADPALPVITPRMFDEQIDASLQTERLLASLSSAFGAAAILLAVVGLYGVMSFLVTRRTQEIGVRLALGGASGGIMLLILRDALAMIAAGIAIALPCVWALGRFVESHLFGVSSTDAWTIGFACALLSLVAAGAAALPARRAAKVSPTEALRFE